MRRLLLLAAVVVAAIAVSAAGAATTVVEEDLLTPFLPVCVDGVYGDGAVIGTVHRVSITTIVQNAGRTMAKFSVTEQGTLQGTGTTYAYKYKQTIMFALPTTDQGMLMQQGFLKAQLVPTSNLGPGDTTLLILSAKFLINANGDTVLVKEEPFAVECK